MCEYIDRLCVNDKNKHHLKQAEIWWWEENKNADINLWYMNGGDWIKKCICNIC